MANKYHSQDGPGKKKPGELYREAVVRGDNAGLDTYALGVGESVPDFQTRVAKTRKSHRDALTRQQNLRLKGSAY